MIRCTRVCAPCGRRAGSALPRQACRVGCGLLPWHASAPPAQAPGCHQATEHRLKHRTPAPTRAACRLLSREENYGATPVAGCQAGDPIDDLEANPTGQAKFFFSFTSVVECRPPQAALPYEARCGGWGTGWQRPAGCRGRGCWGLQAWTAPVHAVS